MKEHDERGCACIICGGGPIIWEADFDADDIDPDKDGVIHYVHCRRCGSRYEIYVPNEYPRGVHGYTVGHIDRSLADDFLKRHHYLSQQGNGFLGKVQYGLFNSDMKFVGCIVFSGVSVVETLIGAFEGFDRNSDQSDFWELTRLAMDDDLKVPNLTSWFVSKAIRMLKHENRVRALISYADSDYHNGYIYQATNFKYYGLTDKKNDFYANENGQEKIIQRGYRSGIDGQWKPRSRKHRYMIVYDKSLVVKWQEQPYPKGDNSEYPLDIPEEMQMNIFDYV